jgi:hypothetical protein
MIKAELSAESREVTGGASRASTSTELQQISASLSSLNHNGSTEIKGQRTVFCCFVV